MGGRVQRDGVQRRSVGIRLRRAEPRRGHVPQIQLAPSLDVALKLADVAVDLPTAGVRQGRVEHGIPVGGDMVRDEAAGGLVAEDDVGRRAGPVIDGEEQRRRQRREREQRCHAGAVDLVQDVTDRRPPGLEMEAALAGRVLGPRKHVHAVVVEQDGTDDLSVAGVGHDAARAHHSADLGAQAERVSPPDGSL